MMRAVQIDVPTISDALLSVRFAVEGDPPLVGHQLVLERGGKEGVVASAWQQQPLSDWPLSPPIQSLQDARNSHGQPVVLGTGLAGRSHWSLAVSLTETARLLFDVACRISSPPVFLGSTYSVGARWKLSPHEHGPGACIEDEQVRLTFRPVINPDVATQLRLEGDHLALCPLVPDPFEQPCTLRWAYEVALVEPT